MFPLTSTTRKPLLYDRFYFGGDDILGYDEGLLTKDDPLFDVRTDIKKRYVEAMEKNDLQTMKDLEDEYEQYQKDVVEKVRDHPERKSDDIIKLCHKSFKNKQQRERLVKALGGKEFCETIPIIYPEKQMEYMGFSLKDLPENSSFAQYEDKAGRKGVLIKVKNKQTGKDDLLCCFERYRETTIGGYFWMTQGCVSLEGIDDIVEFIYQIKPTPHAKYELAK